MREGKKEGDISWKQPIEKRKSNGCHERFGGIGPAIDLSLPMSFCQLAHW
jgi:hypothetical protein